jgi:hypothetical protein
MTAPDPCASIERELAPIRAEILDHPLYSHLTDERTLRVFMEHHVFAVWDFMCLVKALARQLTCQEFIWLPSENPEERRFVNQLVLDEESDLDALSRPRSHFEMYREAMEKGGADCASIDRFIGALRRGLDLDAALTDAQLDHRTVRFVQQTIETARGPELDLAAAFAFGRELLIPSMFRAIVSKLAAADADRWAPFHFYMERHIEIDETEHGPIARGILNRQIAGNDQRYARALEVARTTLRARITLWDAALEAIRS